MFYRSRWLAGLLAAASGMLATEPAARPAAVPVAAAVATVPLSPRYRKVEVAPTTTFIYLGSVALTMPAFERRNGEYLATYAAKVFPFFFYNETGRLRIELPDAQLQTLARGERVTFTGRAQNESGKERRVEGLATPIDSTTGKLKVRVAVMKSVELVFNTTYRFVGE